MQNTWIQIERTYKDVLSSIYDQDEIQAIYNMVLQDIFEIKPAEYILIKEHEIQADKLDKISTILSELQQGRPVQHIIGKAYFYGHDFHVNEHTLIPRPETEELVHKIIADHKNKADLKIIDIGTGTGCIPISLGKKLVGSTLWAVDISNEALQVAKTNSQQLNQDVHFISADILEWEYIFSEKQHFDIIVSNPPYITPEEKQDMHINVLSFEPHTALFVEQTAPLIFYDYIADFAKFHLKDNGALYFEINQYLSQQTKDLLVKKGFNHVEIIKDINGADRIIKAQF